MKLFSLILHLLFFSHQHQHKVSQATNYWSSRGPWTHLGVPVLVEVVDAGDAAPVTVRVVHVFDVTCPVSWVTRHHGLKTQTAQFPSDLELQQLLICLIHNTTGNSEKDPEMSSSNNKHRRKETRKHSHWIRKVKIKTIKINYRKNVGDEFNIWEL